MTAQGLDLVIGPYKDGFNYEWFDGTGKVVCSGWKRGTEQDARKAAHEHLEEK